MSVSHRAVIGSDQTLARSLTYRLLSQAFAYPMADAVEELRVDDLRLVRAWSGALPEDVRAAIEPMTAAWEDGPREELEARFAALFSHVHSADCPMYETDYGPRDIWRQTETLVDIAGFYRAFGMREDRERPDHVATELEFVHVATYKEAWAQAQGDVEHAHLCRDATGSFLEAHLLRWVPSFLARVSTLDRDGPYAAAAELADALLRFEAERFGLGIRDETPVTVETSLSEEPPSLCEEGT